MAGVQQPERRISNQKLRVKGLNYTCGVKAEFKPETEKPEKRLS